MAMDPQTAACVKVLFLHTEAMASVMNLGGMAAFHDALQDCATQLGVEFPAYDAGNPAETDLVLGQLLVDLRTAASAQLSAAI